MSISEILKEAVIEFPRPIGREDSESLLCYLTRMLPANINGKIGYYLSFDHLNGEIRRDNGTLEVSATISGHCSPSSRLIFDTFTSQPFNEDSSYIKAISFALVPGWDLSDYGDERRKLWSDVRGLVNKYFKEKKEVKNTSSNRNN